jgi:hypothetical protein
MSNKITPGSKQPVTYTPEQQKAIDEQALRITKAVVQGGAELREKLIDALPEGTSKDLGAAAAGGTLGKLIKDRFFANKTKNIVRMIQNGAVQGTNDEVAGRIHGALASSAQLSRNLKDVLTSLNDGLTKDKALALFQGIKDGAIAMGKQPEQLEVLANALEGVAQKLADLKKHGKTADRQAPLQAEALANRLELASSALRTFVAGHLRDQPDIRPLT